MKLSRKNKRGFKLSPAGQVTVKMILAAVIVAGLVYVIDLDRIAEAAADADGRWIAAGAALLAANLGLEALLWHRLLREVFPATTLQMSLESLLFGHSLGVFTPGRLGEFAGRPFYLPFEDKWEVGLMVFTHRLFDMIAVLCSGAVMLVFFLRAVRLPNTDMWVAAAFVGAALCALVCTLLLFPKRTYVLLTDRLRLRRYAGHLAFLQRLRTRSAAVFLGLAYLRYAVYATQFVCFLHAFAPSLATPHAYMGVALVQFTKILLPPITFSDIGIREGASVFFFGFLGVAAAEAFNASIMIYFVNLLVPACLGLPLVLRLRLGRLAAAAEADG